ncbi:MAG: hypothetical protein COA83_00550 [Methylophaga sp.]|nr:MAG: hypothetical protein COA83_00550 [Methylophaga sp.]
MNKCLLTIIAVPKIEDVLVDWLLNRPDITGFTSLSASGHGTGHEMSVSEQVTGRRKQIALWIELEQNLAEAVITGLEEDFQNTGIHYWLMPLLKSGSI